MKAFAFTVAFIVSVASSAAEITVLSAGAVKTAVSSLAVTHQRRTGDEISAFYGTVGLLQEKIAAGERADIVIATAEVMSALEQKGQIVPGSHAALGDVGIGVAVGGNAPSPDISTPETLKQTLLKAKSLVYVDPTKGTSGKHIAGVLQRLGIAEAVKSKTIVREGGNVVEAVAKGEVEIGMQQISEILPVKGVKLVGPLPPELQKITTYTAGVMTGANSPQAAAAFIRSLTGTEGRATFLSAGFTAPK